MTLFLMPMLLLWRKTRRTVGSDQNTLVPATVDGALKDLREALERMSSDGGSFAQVQGRLRLLGDRAQKDGLAPEQLLVRLKRTLEFIPRFGNTLSVPPDKEMRERVISSAIDAYFSHATERD